MVIMYYVLYNLAPFQNGSNKNQFYILLNYFKLKTWEMIDMRNMTHINCSLMAHIYFPPCQLNFKS